MIAKAARDVRFPVAAEADFPPGKFGGWFGGVGGGLEVAFCGFGTLDVVLGCGRPEIDFLDSPEAFWVAGFGEWGRGCVVGREGGFGYWSGGGVDISHVGVYVL